MNIVSIVDGDMKSPTIESLPQVNARLALNYAIQIAELASEPLSQTVSAEVTVHGEYVGLSYRRRLMTAQNSHRKNIRGIQNFFGHICAEITHDLALIVLFPRFCIIMPVVNPIVKLLKDIVNQAEALSCSIRRVYNSGATNIKEFSFIFFCDQAPSIFLT